MMTRHSAVQEPAHRPEAKRTGSADAARALYFSLASGRTDHIDDAASRRFLEACLHEVGPIACDMPACADDLDAWIARNTDAVGERYRHYLADRKAGGARQYFGTKAHALHFLKGVAPTKLVDGAWLHGLMAHWNDGRFASLIRIYLEELGCGQPDKNHVVLYKKLLATHGCPKWDDLPASHFVQGAIQLALARQADRFLPELIGFNLGYEQLPLHLLITAHELDELGIDPYYFTLHVTVDNADTGHAQTALDGLRQAWPVIGDGGRFYQRVINGYKLNSLGAGTNDIIDGFDLEQELIAILANKSVAGRQVHVETCRVAGRSVNEWLATPHRIPELLAALQATGWIKRHQDPENSRFWKLIQGERAEMFGVFNAYEQQVLFDWIAGDGAAGQPLDGADGGSVIPMRRQASFRAQVKLSEARAARVAAAGPALSLVDPPIADTPMRRAAVRDDDGATDFNLERRQLEQALNRTASRDDAMQLLAGLMSPALHHTPTGLQATRLFVRMLG